MRAGEAISAAVVVALVAVLPLLNGTIEDVVLVGTTLTATVVLARTAWKRPRAGRPWVTAAISGAFLTAHYVAFAVRYAARPSVLDEGPLVPALIALTAIGGMVAAARSLTITCRPLLSAPTSRRAVRIGLPLLLFGTTSIPLSDPALYPPGSERLAVVVPSVLVGFAVAGWAAIAQRLRPLVRAGRRIELRLVLAFLSVQLLNVIGVALDSSAFWSVPSVIGLVLTAIASLDPSAPMVGLAVSDRPVLSGTRLHWAFVSVVPPLGVVLVSDMVQRPPLPLVVAAVVGSVLLFLTFGRVIDDGPRLRDARPDARTAQLARALPDALVHDRFRFAYQPIARIDDGVVVGFEALLRWAPPSLDEVTPTEVIEAARRYDLGDEVERSIVAAVARDLPTVRAALAGRDVYLAVNVSPAALQTPGWADRLLADVDPAGQPMRGLLLEIVESGLVQDWEAMRANVAALRAAGMAVALDDFGTGGSNLEYLRHITVDVVKLDRSLLRWAAGSGRDVVRSVAEAARVEGLTVVAEGVEGDEEFAVARGLGVHLVQGYAVGRPAPLAEALRRAAPVRGQQAAGPDTSFDRAGVTAHTPPRGQGRGPTGRAPFSSSS